MRNGKRLGKLVAREKRKKKRALFLFTEAGFS